jgi:hypothetical protein
MPSGTQEILDLLQAASHLRCIVLSVSITTYSRTPETVTSYLKKASKLVIWQHIDMQTSYIYREYSSQLFWAAAEKELADREPPIEPTGTECRMYSLANQSIQFIQRYR